MSIWALKGATHCNRATRSNYLTLTLLALCEARSGSCSLSPDHTRSFDLCALGLRIVKAAGLLQAFSLQNVPQTPMKKTKTKTKASTFLSNGMQMPA